MKKFIKSLAVFLALVMVFYVIPLSSLAESETSIDETEVKYINSDEPVVIEREETEKRTANSKTYLMSDGTHKVFIYAYDIHYSTEDGWLEYDVKTINEKKVGYFRESSGLEISESLIDFKDTQKSLDKKESLFSYNLLPTFNDEIIILDSILHFDIEDNSDNVIYVNKTDSMIAKERLEKEQILDEAISSEMFNTESGLIDIDNVIDEVYDIAYTSGNNCRLDITSIMQEYYSYNNESLSLELGNLSSELIVPASGVIMTMSYMEPEEYKQAGSWDQYGSIGHVTAAVNTFNGSLRLFQTDVSAGANIMPITIEHTYDSKRLSSNDAFGYGWDLNINSRTLGFVDFEALNRNTTYRELPLYNSFGDETVYYSDILLGRYSISNSPSTITVLNALKIFKYEDGYCNTTNYDYYSGKILKSIDSNGNYVDYIYSDTNYPLNVSSIRINGTTYLTFTYNSSGALTKILNNITGDYAEYQYSSTYNGSLSSTNKGYLRRATYKNGSGHDYTYNSDGTINKITDRVNTAGTSYLSISYTTATHGGYSSKVINNMYRYTNGSSVDSYLFGYSDYGSTVKSTNENRFFCTRYNSTGNILTAYSYSYGSTDVVDALQAYAYNSSEQIAKTAGGNFNATYNAVKNSGFDSTSNWELSTGITYTTALGHDNVLRLVGTSSGYRSSRQVISQSDLTAKGINNKSRLLVSGWVRSQNSLPVEANPPSSDLRSFGYTVVLNYEGGHSSKHVINGNHNNTMWQYISLPITPTYTTYTLTSIYIYCSNDFNSGTALFDDVNLTVVNMNEFSYNNQYKNLSNDKNDFGSSVVINTSYNYLPSYQISNTGTRYDYTYDDKNNVKTIKEYAAGGVINNTTYNDYDSNGNVIRTQLRDPSFNKFFQTEYSYTNDKQYLAGMTDARENTTSYNYNSDKTLNYIEHPDSNRTAYKYDSKGRIQYIIADRNKNNSLDTSTEEYVKYTYGGQGVLSNITTNTSNYQLFYDYANRMTSVGLSTYASRLVSYEYDSSNRVTKTTYGNGYYKQPVYNDKNQISQVKHNGNVKASYRYNGNGQLSSYDEYINNNNSLGISFTYDKYGRLSIENTWDIIGVYEKLRKSYTYDSYNRPITVNETLENYSYTRNIQYKTNSDLIDYIKYSNNHYVAYNYDVFGRVTSKYNRSTATGGTVWASETYSYLDGTTSVTTTPLLKTVSLKSGTSFTYAYDSKDNISSVKEGTTTKQSYVYDAIGQLTRENNAYDNKTYVYTYDKGGNITSKKTYAYTTGTLGTVQNTRAYSYTGDRLTSLNGSAITYDGAGNPLQWGGNSLSWTGKQLSSVYLGMGGLSFLYTEAGLRYSKSSTLSNKTHKYYYDSSNQLIYEEIRGSSSTDTIYYMYDASGISGIIYNGSKYFFGKNAQGDVIDIYSNTGTKVVRYNYDAWGNCTIASDTSGIGIATINPIRYRSYYYDTETGWYYLQSRYYDPGVGRFISADSIMGANGDILSYNLYAYCLNNPVNMIDPDGCAPKWWQTILIGVGIIAGTALIAAAFTFTGGGAAAFLATWGSLALSGAKVATLTAITAGAFRAGKAALNGGNVGKSFILGFADGFYTGSIYAGGSMILSAAAYRISGLFNGGYGWSAGKWVGGYQTPSTPGISFGTYKGGINGGRKFAFDIDTQHGFHFHTRIMGYGKIKTHRWMMFPIITGIGVGLGDGWSEW